MAASDLTCVLVMPCVVITSCGKALEALPWVQLLAMMQWHDQECFHVTVLATCMAAVLECLWYLVHGSSKSPHSHSPSQLEALSWVDLTSPPIHPLHLACICCLRYSRTLLWHQSWRFYNVQGCHQSIKAHCISSGQLRADEMPETQQESVDVDSIVANQYMHCLLGKHKGLWGPTTCPHACPGASM